MVVMDGQYVVWHRRFGSQMPPTFVDLIDTGRRPATIGQLLFARNLMFENLNPRLRLRKAGQHDGHHTKQGAERRKARHQCTRCLHHTGDIRVTA